MPDFELLQIISNPYYPLDDTTGNKFIGRTDIISKADTMIDEHKAEGNASNLLFIGPKAIGKSSILERIRHNLSSSYQVCQQELSKGSQVNTQDFFMEIYQQIIDNIANAIADNEKEFDVDILEIDQKQVEIFMSLHVQGEHESKITERALKLPSFSHSKKSFQYNDILADFRLMLRDLRVIDDESYGIALVIDEFQELARNIEIIEILAKLSHDVKDLLIVGAGLDSIELENEKFEKFHRTTRNLRVKPFTSDEITNAILSPLAHALECTMYEASQYIAPNAIEQVKGRAGGNPMHIRLLCGEMLEYVQKNAIDGPLLLNLEVLRCVMNQYSSISEKSRLLSRSLNSCDPDQLAAIARLFKTDGVDLKTCVLYKNAYNNITTQVTTQLLNSIIEDYKLIESTSIFGLKNYKMESCEIEHIEDMEFEKSANYMIVFEGDNIDKLYLKYYYETITAKEIESLPAKKLEDLLALRLMDTIRGDLFAEEIGKKKDIVSIGIIDDKNKWGEYTKDSKGITRIIDKKGKDLLSFTNKEKELIEKFADKFSLRTLAILGHMLELEGYYVISIEAKIRTTVRRIVDFVVIKKGSKINFQKYKTMVRNIKTRGIEYEEYLTELLDIRIAVVPSVYNTIIWSVSVSTDRLNLLRLAKERKFSEAVELAQMIYTISIKITIGGKAKVPVVCINDYGFCLIGIKDNRLANQQLSSIADKYPLAKYNLASLKAFTSDFTKAKKYLRKLSEKTRIYDMDASILHLAIPHRGLKRENIILEDISLSNATFWSLAIIYAKLNNRSASNTQVKNVRPRSDYDVLVNMRVAYWIKYYLDSKTEALESAKKSLETVPTDSHLWKDIEEDIKLIGSEIKTAE